MAEDKVTVPVHCDVVHGDEAVLTVGVVVHAQAGDITLTTEVPDPVRMPAATVAEQAGIPVADLPGAKFTATLADGQLSEFRLA